MTPRRFQIYTIAVLPHSGREPKRRGVWRLVTCPVESNPNAIPSAIWYNGVVFRA